MFCDSLINKNIRQPLNGASLFSNKIEDKITKLNSKQIREKKLNFNNVLEYNAGSCIVFGTSLEI